MPESVKDITVAIIAHNAAGTIGRALASVLEDCDAPILLVDDHSTDNTAAVAQDAAGDRLRVVRPAAHIGVGNARQTALEAIETPYGIWLDADDEFMPGRVARHAAMLRARQCRLVYDAGILVSGETGGILKQLDMPAFLQAGAKIGRVIERNWLPLLHCSFDTAFAREVGYDPSFEAAEDYDFLLRVLTAGGQVSLLDAPGYRYYHYDVSVSRALDRSMRFSGLALAKHETAALEAMLREKETLSEAEIHYSLAAFATATERTQDAAHHLSALAALDARVAPYGRSGLELATFLSATLALGSGDHAAAADMLTRLFARWPDAAVANNLAVALARLGNEAVAKSLWQQALVVIPGYVDAEHNLAAEAADALRITRLPLRPLASRADYKA